MNRYWIRTRPDDDFPVLAGQNVLDVDPGDSPNEISVTIPSGAAAAFEQHLDACPAVVEYREITE